MSLQPESNSHFDDEDLVAYLDGELDTETAARIRRCCDLDSVLRKRVDDLQASWNLLEQLPSVQPNPQVAQTTIELITQGMVRERTHGWRALLARWRWPLLALASLSACGAGLLDSYLELRRFKQAVVNDLPVLTHLKDLDNIDSLAWLAELETVENLSAAGLPLYVEPPYDDLPSRGSQLNPWVTSLDANRQIVLKSAYQSFTSAPKSRKDELRQMAKQVTQGDTEATATAIKAYAGLLNKIGTSEAVQLMSVIDLKARRAELEVIIRRELAIAYPLSDEEKTNIVEWCDHLKENNFFLLNSEDPDGEVIRLLDAESSNSAISAEDVQQLVQCVHERGQSLLADIEPTLQTKVLKLWLYNSLPSTRPRPQFSSGELFERFKKLPTSTQNELIYLPSGEVIKRLSRDGSMEDTSFPDTP